MSLEEDVGFEPTERFRVQLLSRELRSTALAIFLYSLYATIIASYLCYVNRCFLNLDQHLHLHLHF